MNDYKFGNFVCYLRERKGMTQADVAAMLDVTPAAVSKWENGESKPRVEVLFRLAEILEVSPEELMAGEYAQSHLPPVAEQAPITKRGMTPKAKRRLIIGIVASAVVTVLLLVGMIIGIVLLALNSVKDTEQYTLAYEYLTESETFKISGASEEDIRLNSYSSSSSISNGKRRTVCEISFIVDEWRMTVILHKNSEDLWYVCEDCTHFK